MVWGKIETVVSETGEGAIEEGISRAHSGQQL